MGSNHTISQEELLILFGRYDWIDNYMSNRGKFLRYAAVGGGIIGVMIPVIFVVVFWTMAGSWGLGLGPMLLVILLCVTASVTVCSVLTVRSYNRSMPKRVGIGEDGVLFENRKEEKTFVKWKDIDCIGQVSWSDVGESMVQHGGEKAGLGFKVVSADIARGIKDKLKDKGYGVANDGTVIEPQRTTQ